MHRRSFFGYLAAIFGAGAAAAITKPAEKVAELDAPATPIDKIVKPQTTGNMTVVDRNAAKALEYWEKFVPKAPSKADQEDCLRYALEMAKAQDNAQDFHLQGIGIACPRCGNIGGPNCQCGWNYSAMFVDYSAMFVPKPWHSPEQLRAAPFGYRVPDDFISKAEFSYTPKRGEAAFAQDVSNFERVRRIWQQAKETGGEVSTELKDGLGRFTVSTKECWSEVEERFKNISA